MRAALRAVDPQAQTAPAAPVAVDAGPADRPHERGGEGPGSLRHALSSRMCITYCNTTRGRIHRMAVDRKGRGDYRKCQ